MIIYTLTCGQFRVASLPDLCVLGLWKETLTTAPTCCLALEMENYFSMTSCYAKFVFDWAVIMTPSIFPAVLQIFFMSVCTRRQSFCLLFPLNSVFAQQGDKLCLPRYCLRGVYWYAKVMVQFTPRFRPHCSVRVRYRNFIMVYTRVYTVHICESTTSAPSACAKLAKGFSLPG